ncbi:hypothetical protein ACSBLW_07245 [Thioclava sp. FR2]|uniref:hypothetical protein n=1 Tax=Thioclava sp. FR2 TaxID=3445780 RepID=UPI003EBE397B
MPNEFWDLLFSLPHFWPVSAIVVIFGVSWWVYWALLITGRTYRRPIWEEVPEGWRGPVIFLGLLWLGLFVLTVSASYWGVWKLIHPANVIVENSGTGTSASLGFGTLLAAMLGAPFVIWCAVLKHQTVRFQKDGHITDRINKAVEMLGAEKTVKKKSDNDSGASEESAPNLEVRIGAILSLERIAQDSVTYDRGRDHVRVMEILCGYLRENSHREAPKEVPSNCAPASKNNIEVAGLAVSARGTLTWAEAQDLHRPTSDIGAALSVIIGRTRTQNNSSILGSGRAQVMIPCAHYYWRQTFQKSIGAIASTCVKEIFRRRTFRKLTCRSPD